MAGLFITLEGPDGCGKTTQALRLAAVFEAAGIPYLVTREPGGSQIGEKIRQILIDPGNSALDPRAEVFLFMANRAQNLTEIVRPAVATGKIVISDRHRDSSVAFQGGGRELGFDFVEALNQAACGELKPDATLYLDIPVKLSVARARAQRQDLNQDGKGDRFEREKQAFHQRVFDAYQILIQREPDRFLVIDATGSIEEVTARIIKALATRFPAQLGRVN